MKKSLKIAVLSSFTLLGLPRTLKETANKLGIEPEIYLGQYDQYTQEIFNKNSGLHRFRPDLIFLFLDTRSILNEIFFSPYEIDDSERRRVVSEILKRLDELVSRAANTGAKIVIHNFEVPDHSPLGILENKQSFGLVEMVERLNSDLRDNYRSSNQVFVFDYNAFVSRLGKKEIGDPKMYYLGDTRIAVKHLPALAGEYLAYAKPLLALSKKCVVLDLDNTLWGGVLGEEGMGGIKLGPTPEGRPFWEFQKHLSALTKRGVILAINSKNNLAEVEEVFAKHPHMVLKRDDFLARRINWQDKILNMKELAEELNLGLDSLVFFDDDPTNRELVKNFLPTVRVIDLPADPVFYPGILVSVIKEFNVLQLTEEDKKRGLMYLAEKKRRSLKTSTADLRSFLDSLNLKLKVLSADELTIPRIAQLTQKTNQFNLTTRRLTEETVRQMVQARDYLVKAFQIEDVFGDYGITGVLIVKKSDQDWLVEDFLLSCRILGKEIEFAVMAYLINQARRVKVKNIFGRFIPTAKNDPAKNFYKQAGFVEAGRKKNGEIDYVLSLPHKNYPKPEFIKIINEHE